MIVIIMTASLLLVACSFDFEIQQAVLEDADYKVANINCVELLNKNLLSGTLSEIAESVGNVMIACNIDVEDVANSNLIIAIKITNISIIQDILEQLTDSDFSQLLSQLEDDSIEDIKALYPEFADVIDALSELDSQQRDELYSSLQFKIVGSTLLISTQGALEVVGQDNII